MSALEAVYREAYTVLCHRSLRPARRKDFRVEFYPYAGLRSTIYARDHHYEVRLGDLLQHAPLDVHYSLACVLLGKIDRRLRPSRSEKGVYAAWSRRPEVLAAHEAARRQRGRKRLLPPRGVHHDLQTLFHRLNRDYFSARLGSARLGWSPGRGRSLWGHHDEAHEAIVINQRLDSPRVPSYVVESILYHEMLHHHLGTQYGRTGRRIVHSRVFREAEQRFAHHAEAQAFLKSVSERRIRL